MSDNKSARELIPVAAVRFGQAVHQVPSDKWNTGTPCSEWSVRDLVNHVAGEHLWVPPLLDGKTVEQVGDQFDGDVLGDDPVAVWDTAIEASVNAFASVSDQDQVHLSFGTFPVDEYANQMLVDLTVHAWDLARGAGVEERLEPSTVEASLAYARLRFEEYSGSGMFGTPVEIDSEDPQETLLALLGRDPR